MVGEEERQTGGTKPFKLKKPLKTNCIVFMLLTVSLVGEGKAVSCHLLAPVEVSLSNTVDT